MGVVQGKGELQGAEGVGRAKDGEGNARMQWGEEGLQGVGLCMYPYFFSSLDYKLLPPWKIGP